LHVVEIDRQQLTLYNLQPTRRNTSTTVRVPVIRSLMRLRILMEQPTESISPHDPPQMVPTHRSA